MTHPRILAMVMAGGEGRRLHPLTIERSKPAVPFGGRYRIVDFVLSSLVNSEIQSIYLLVQYKSQSLIEHVRRSWVLSPRLPDHFVTVVPPQMRTGPEWFQGTADAVYQNINLFGRHHADLVAVFGADHIYRMDVRQMVGFHLDRGADVTVAALPVPLDQASSFGIISAEADGRIREFIEKPERPVSMPGDPMRAYASMGNYLFSTPVLTAALQEAHYRGEHDFGKDVIPRLCKTHRVFAYDFFSNKVPGAYPFEEKGYWRDVGNIGAYYAAHQDLLGAEAKFEIFNPQWPIYSSHYQGPVAKVIRGEIENSSLGAGTVVNGATVRNSIVRREVWLEEDVVIEDSIVMDYVRIQRGSRLRRAIVDRYNVLQAGTHLGYDPEQDRARYHLDSSGVVIVPQGLRGELIY
ncbi:MAG: glucose-1-phosphate adenylyltransferase [Nitrospirae bacterium]|nr:glucose-1-phosphate adenylyltransferase [Nitrospirota bacterium]